MIFVARVRVPQRITPGLGFRVCNGHEDKFLVILVMMRLARLIMALI